MLTLQLPPRDSSVDFTPHGYEIIAFVGEPLLVLLLLLLIALVLKIIYMRASPFVNLLRALLVLALLLLAG